MDGKFLNLLQSAMLRELCRAIQKNKEDFDAANCSAESVFANIEYIYDEIPEKEFGEPTGATMKFMPKRYKEMVMRLISPESRRRHTRYWRDWSSDVCSSDLD